MRGLRQGRLQQLLPRNLRWRFHARILADLPAVNQSDFDSGLTRDVERRARRVVGARRGRRGLARLLDRLLRIGGLLLLLLLLRLRTRGRRRRPRRRGLWRLLLLLLWRGLLARSRRR